MRHVSRWEKAARKMVKMYQDKSVTGYGYWVVEHPSLYTETSNAFYKNRSSARGAAKDRIRELTKILQQASKLAGF